MVQMSSSSSRSDTKSRNDVTKSRNDVTKSRNDVTKSRNDSIRSCEIGMEDGSEPGRRSDMRSSLIKSRNTSPKSCDQDDLEDLDDKKSAIYLQHHAEKNSDKACEILRGAVEDAVRAITQRAAMLEAGIGHRKEKVIKTLEEGRARNVSSESTTSDLFKLLDRKNSITVSNGGASLVDYKEFMFFDRDSARHLNYTIKTLGDPSYSVRYSRDYNAIALHPEIFGTSGKDLGQFHGPTAVDTDSTTQNLYVCDSMNCRIVVYSGDNQPLYSIGQKGKGDTELDRPSSVAVDETGQMYIADSFNDRMCVYSTEGDWKFNVGGRGQLNKPRGVACAKNGEIFVVSDTGNQRIMVYSGSGTCKGNFGKLGMKEGQFVRPQGITIWDNKVYVSDSFNYRVQIFDIEGRLLDSMGKQGSKAGEFEEPRDIAVDSNGNVLVTDTRKNSLQIFDKHGAFIREYGSQGDEVHHFDGPEGVHADEINRVFIADRKNDRVHIL